MNPTTRRTGAVVATALCSVFVMHSATAAELLERAVLPSASFSPGPTSGQYASGANGVVLPLINKQPVQGFSAVLRGPAKGTYLVCRLLLEKKKIITRYDPISM